MSLRDFPGDNRRSAWNRPPEIIAQEQKILTLADALLTWMAQQEWPARMDKVVSFMTHTLSRPASDFYDGETKQWVLEKLDPDANRLFMELLRAAWHRRMWQERFGERVPGESV